MAKGGRIGPLEHGSAGKEGRGKRQGVSMPSLGKEEWMQKAARREGDREKKKEKKKEKREKEEGNRAGRTRGCATTHQTSVGITRAVQEKEGGQKSLPLPSPAPPSDIRPTAQQSNPDSSTPQPF